MDYLTFTHKINKTSFTCGLDDPFKAKDFKHFITYPYPVNYIYNSRGFRDVEWPDSFDNTIWCIGDSFTTGIGSPVAHTWPFILQHTTGKRCINLGIEGAANKLISNVANQVLTNFKPDYVVVMWSYFHRRYADPWKFLYYEEQSVRADDCNDFLFNYHFINNLSNNIFNILIPRETIELPLDFQLLRNYPVLDLARDSHHFDYLTSEYIVAKIVEYFKLPLANA